MKLSICCLKYNFGGTGSHLLPLLPMSRRHMYTIGIYLLLLLVTTVQSQVILIIYLILIYLFFLLLNHLRISFTCCSFILALFNSIVHMRIFIIIILCVYRKVCMCVCVFVCFLWLPVICKVAIPSDRLSLH